MSDEQAQWTDEDWSYVEPPSTKDYEARIIELEADNARLRAELKALKGEVIVEGWWVPDTFWEPATRMYRGPYPYQPNRSCPHARLIASPAPPEESEP